MQQKKFEEQLRRALALSEEPSRQLNEAVTRAVRLKSTQHGKAVSLWYLPMLLNAVFFLLLMVFFKLVLANQLVFRVLAAGCLYCAGAGVVLTIAGMKFSGLRQKLTVRLDKRSD